MREELIPRRRDMTGDDTTAVHPLTEPWMTERTVRDVGRPHLGLVRPSQWRRAALLAAVRRITEPQ